MIENGTRYLVIVVLGVVLAACSVLPQRLTVQPSLEGVESGLVGRSVEVGVRVVDLRAGIDIGYTETWGGDRQPIATTGDLLAVLADSLSEGLRKKGFVPCADWAGKGRLLTVEVEKVSHVVVHGLVKTTVQTSVVAKTMASCGRRTLSNQVDVDNQSVMVAKPSIEDNQRLVNKALSDLIEKIFQDQETLVLLARGE
ncbi:MAG: hypothetical protein JXO49_10135 [Deltaproteobacteria bacterium]|nr:hypothetical protein [Candidatus Anaeroferrophillus wilburensis]MBN2889691.1 hypothetical protein [Deltaproteobacteria bacterium]